VSNPCVALQSEGACNGKSGCSWTPEEAVCYLTTHSCFGKAEGQCLGPTCRWCDNGQHTDDIVDGEISKLLPDLVTVENPVNTLQGQNLKRFVIKYSARDKLGNRAKSVSRIVRVEDTIKPEMALIGEEIVEVRPG